MARQQTEGYPHPRDVSSLRPGVRPGNPGPWVASAGEGAVSLRLALAELADSLREQVEVFEHEVREIDDFRRVLGGARGLRGPWVGRLFSKLAHVVRPILQDRRHQALAREVVDRVKEIGSLRLMRAKGELHGTAGHDDGGIVVAGHQALLGLQPVAPHVRRIVIGWLVERERPGLRPEVMAIVAGGPEDLDERCAVAALERIEVQDLRAFGLLLLGVKLRREPALLRTERASDLLQRELRSRKTGPLAKAPPALHLLAPWL